jgi:hypothetical protein
MGITSGHCTLIFDGRAQPGFSFSVVESDPSKKRYGFLSGPVELLAVAQAASWLQIQLPSAELLDIEILQLNPAGLALISIRDRA